MAGLTVQPAEVIGANTSLAGFAVAPGLCGRHGRYACHGGDIIIHTVTVTAY
jgi:hypothetical protein